MNYKIIATDLDGTLLNSKMELSAENKRQFLIPRRFGHGFVTLTDEVEFLYKADNLYAPAYDGGIRWDDPELGILLTAME